jgi:hypothetical protein
VSDKQEKAYPMRWIDGELVALSQDELVVELRRIIAERDAARDALQAIADYPPTDGRRNEDGYPSEIVYDEYAYCRMVDTYRNCARAALKGTP